MPRRRIDRATNFIIEEESWAVIEYDHTSVPGTIYLSLTENKINLIYDDLENNIADTDKRAKYELILPPVTQTFVAGEPINLVYTITKNGKPIVTAVDYISDNKKVAKVVNDELMAIAEGEANIQVVLRDCDDIKPEALVIHIEVGASTTEFSCYIEGPSTIRLDREAEYKIINTTGAEVEAAFSIDSELCTVTTFAADSCKIKANNKNKLGKFILKAQVGEGYFTKEIEVIPLW